MWASMREGSFIPAIAAYLAFTGPLLALIASGSPMARSAVIVGPLAVSLPALGASLYIAAVGWVGPEPASRLVRQAVIALGLACSAAGFMVSRSCGTTRTPGDRAPGARSRSRQVTSTR